MFRRHIAQQILLRYSEAMPVALAQKVRTLRVDFRSAARLADLLGVSRSQVTRWLRGAGIDRLLMMFANQPSIREVILFPLMRPEGGRATG